MKEQERGLLGKHSKTLSTLKVHFFVFLHFLLEDKQYAGIQLQSKSSLDVQLAQNNAFQSMRLLYVLLTKQEVKMAGYWPSSLLHFVWTEMSRSQGHKNAQREQGQYPAILTELACSIKHLLYGIPRLHIALPQAIPSRE